MAEGKYNQHQPKEELLQQNVEPQQEEEDCGDEAGGDEAGDNCEDSDDDSADDSDDADDADDDADDADDADDDSDDDSDRQEHLRDGAQSLIAAKFRLQPHAQLLPQQHEQESEKEQLQRQPQTKRQLKRQPSLPADSNLRNSAIRCNKMKIVYESRLDICKTVKGMEIDGHWRRVIGVDYQENLLVADSERNKIHCFGITMKMKFHREILTGISACTLAVAPQRSNVIVVKIVCNTFWIVVFNYDWKVLNEFSIGHDLGRILLTVDKDDMIVVLDEANILTIYDRRGTVKYRNKLWVIMIRPTSIAVNKNKEVFFSDYVKDCVRVYDYKGRYLRKIGGPENFEYPIRVGISPSGMVVVASLYIGFTLATFDNNGDCLASLRTTAHHSFFSDLIVRDDTSVVLYADNSLYVYRFCSV